MDVVTGQLTLLLLRGALEVFCPFKIYKTRVISSRMERGPPPSLHNILIPILSPLENVIKFRFKIILN